MKKTEKKTEQTGSFRVLKMPSNVWAGVRAKDQTARTTIDMAISANLPKLIEELRGIGIKGEIKNDRKVRTIIPHEVLASLKFGKEQTGMDASKLLNLCLSRYVNGDKPIHFVKIDKAPRGKRTAKSTK